MKTIIITALLTLSSITYADLPMQKEKCGGNLDATNSGQTLRSCITGQTVKIEKRLAVAFCDFRYSIISLTDRTVACVYKPHK